VSATTQCPTCSTRFKVSQAQLDAHQGLVRCGRCQAVFNATEYLQDERPNPQLDLLMTANAGEQTPPEKSAEIAVEFPVESTPATHQELDFSLSAPAHLDPQNEEPRQTETQVREWQPATAQIKSEPITQAQKITFTHLPDEAVSEPDEKKSVWQWVVGSLFLLITLLAQAAYFFRVEIAANQPGFKPALVSYCNLLQCSVPLPQKADLMSIESSDLEADPAQSSVIALNALLRNHASYAQAYPQLELTLTDAQDKPLARRTFSPPDYLKPGEDQMQGLAANRELSVKLNLDTTDLKPSGYRLFLFYPQ